MTDTRSGVIVAGGRSTRFGDADKAVALLGGTPMIRRVADRLATVIDELVINCRPNQVAAIRDALDGYDHRIGFAEDPEPDLGPMAGIQTGLRAVEGEYAAVVACDMPFVEPALVDHLFERAAGKDAAVPRLDDGWYQPTQAVYRAEPMIEACETALAAGQRKIIAPLEHLEYVVVDEAEALQYADAETFRNLNTREEFEAAARQLTE